MLKPFADRVAATRQFLSVLLDAGIRRSDELEALRHAQDHAYRNTSRHPVDWTLDTTAVDSLPFNGYEARYEWSTITAPNGSGMTMTLHGPGTLRICTPSSPHRRRTSRPPSSFRKPAGTSPNGLTPTALNGSPPAGHGPPPFSVPHYQPFSPPARTRTSPDGGRNDGGHGRGPVVC